MKFKVKYVFGTDAVAAHVEGLPDKEVADRGHIEEFAFDTAAELRAFEMGLEAAEGWLDMCVYDERNLA